MTPLQDLFLQRLGFRKPSIHARVSYGEVVFQCDRVGLVLANALCADAYRLLQNHDSPGFGHLPLPLSRQVAVRLHQVDNASSRRGVVLAEMRAARPRRRCGGAKQPCAGGSGSRSPVPYCLSRRWCRPALAPMEAEKYRSTISCNRAASAVRLCMNKVSASSHMRVTMSIREYAQTRGGGVRGYLGRAV
jgi:hypothetical protein